MFKPQSIYYEKEIENYQLGKELLEKCGYPFSIIVARVFYSKK